MLIPYEYVTDKTRIIKRIFQEHWDEFLCEHKDKIPKEMQPSVIDAVGKMLMCRTKQMGYVVYVCTNCSQHPEKIIFFTCKSRFCTSCGKIYVDNWVKKMTAEILDKPHRHLVFTIPEQLRTKIYWNRSLLKVLSDVAAKVVMRNTQDLTAGIITVVHTFGRDLSFNPHVHVLVSEGGLDDNAQWFGIYFLPYSKLRKQWQYHLLTELRKCLPKTKDVSQLIGTLFADYPKGFYVNAESKMDDAQKAAKYVGRYIARPSIAESRIQSYDGETVTFTYEDHQTGETQSATFPVLQFIGRLVMHIPQKGYQMVKRYGLYARHIKPAFKKVLELMHKAKQLLFSFFTPHDTWRQRIINRYQKDPLLCSVCGVEMELWLIWHPEYGVLYDIMTDSQPVIETKRENEKDQKAHNPPEEIQLYLPLHPVWV